MYVGSRHKLIVDTSCLLLNKAFDNITCRYNQKYGVFVSLKSVHFCFMAMKRRDSLRKQSVKIIG